MIRIAKYVAYDIARNRFIIFYTIFLFAVSCAIYSLDSDAGKSTLSLLNIVLLVVPLVAIIFTTTHFFNSYEFMELLLSQPVDRRTVFIAEFFSVAAALSAAFVIGVGLPSILIGEHFAVFELILSGVLLTFVFVSMAFVASVSTRDKAKGIGIALLFWIYFTLIYDGFVLYVVYSFSDYPLEKVTLALRSLNPIDLARIVILLKLDISALMGYTGAFYREFFGSNLGAMYALLCLLLWIVLPMLWALRIFCKKDI